VRRAGLRSEAGNDDDQGRELDGELAGSLGILSGRRVSLRDRLEAFGLLLGILGVLLVVAMTVGAAPPV
jgi:hypothetical protein